jgi:probable rRNA maturation factor
MPPENQTRVILRVRENRARPLPESDILQERLRDVLRLVLERLEIPVGGGELELGVTITGDSETRELNAKYMEIDAATDVLSFPMLTPEELAGIEKREGAPVSLGDIVISMETVTRQAKELGMGTVERFAECLVHGILHLLGCDHAEESDRRRMESLEDELVPGALSML